MEPPVFFVDPGSHADGLLTLPKTESHHALKVMRMKRGDLLIAVDGLGNGYRGEIVRTTREKLVEVRVHSQTRNLGEPGVILTLAAGLSTGYKFDTVVEKGTELGVKRFVPLITDKSKVSLDDPKRMRTKVTRYEKVALAAMKQCRRSYRPEITNPTSFTDYLKEIDTDAVSLIFHPSANAQPLDKAGLSSATKRVNIIVGAEPGFSPEEMHLAQEKGVQAISLGRRILRAETAGPVACALVMNALGELR
jgi:16S rRNA (uracil1498-N3)-methyltransferase